MRAPALLEVFDSHLDLNSQLPEEKSSLSTKNILFHTISGFIKFVHVGGWDQMGGDPINGTMCAHLSCSDLSIYDNYTIVEVVSNQYFGPLIVNNPNYREFFRENFENVLFSKAFNYLFK